MLARDVRRLALVIGPLMGLLLLCMHVWDQSQPQPVRNQISEWLQNGLSQQPDGQDQPPPSAVDHNAGLQDAGLHDAGLQDAGFQNEVLQGATDAHEVADAEFPEAVAVAPPDGFSEATHNEIFSASTGDGEYFLIEMADLEAYNPNIIAHPTLNETWIVVAQWMRPIPNNTHSLEISCSAALSSGVLRCIETPRVVSVAATFSDNCNGKTSFFNLNIGPHDARVFYGPHKPFIVYGSNSEITCYGQWIQDLRVLVYWGLLIFTPEDEFRSGTEMQRPPPMGEVEKNWFVFWDKDDQLYVHHDVAPRRVFAKMAPDGSVGEDLAPAASTDETCLSKLMPTLGSPREAFHQSTNSLSVTMCNRADPACTPNDQNTFLFTIFHHQKSYTLPAGYEPHVMVFHRRAPFEVHGVTQKPLWVHGRRTTEVRSQMFYITSMSWKTQGQTYHGYLDDILFLAFGIDDKIAAGIDVRAADVLRGLGLCADT